MSGSECTKTLCVLVNILSLYVDYSAPAPAPPENMASAFTSLSLIIPAFLLIFVPLSICMVLAFSHELTSILVWVLFCLFFELVTLSQDHNWGRVERASIPSG